MDNLANLLQRVWHFRHLSPQDLQRIVSAGRLRRFQEGSVIFREGEPSAGMFVLLRGKVNLIKAGLEDQEQIIGTIEPVIMFNELAVIDGGPNPTSAVAAKDCLTWNVSHADFVALVRDYPDPEIGLGLLRVLAARMRLLINRVEDLSDRPVHARLAKLLLDLSDHGSKEIDRREYPIRELAAHIASVPEVVSRSLGFLAERGLIHCDRRVIRVVDPTGLAETAQLASPDHTFR